MKPAFCPPPVSLVASYCTPSMPSFDSASKFALMSRPGHTPQSCAQLEQLSLLLHNKSPHSGSLQAFVQLSVLTVLPSSHISLPSMTPLPHTAGGTSASLTQFRFCPPAMNRTRSVCTPAVRLKPLLPKLFQVWYW